MFVLAISVLLGVYNSPQGTFGDEGALRWGISLGFSGLLVCAMGATQRRGTGALAAFGLVSFGVLAGTLMLLVLDAESTGAAVGRNLLVVSRRASWVVLWFAIAGSVERETARATSGTNSAPAHSLSAASSRYGLWFVALHGVARLAVELVRLPATGDQGGLALAAEDALPWVVLVALLAVSASGMVIVAMMVVSAMRDAQRAQVSAALEAGAGADPLPDMPADLGGESGSDALTVARHRACLALARAHQLTDRETDVLVRLSLGHTVPRIARDLSITENTVRTHSKSVYAKLGCHSKQELIDIVSERMKRG